MLQSFNRLFAGGDKSEEETAEFEDVIQLEINKIVPNKYQPRVKFDEEKITELAQTLKTHGMIQPIVVRKKNDDEFELIAGERRFRAAQQLEWETIPTIVRDLTDTETASIALIENIQRENLSVIEEANAYVQLLEMHSLTQEALAQRLGKSQSTIANRIRLLSLPSEVQEAIIDKQISERHARALLKLPDEASQLQFLSIIVEQELTVRQTDELVKKHLEGGKEKKKKRKPKTQFISKDIRIATNTIRRSLDLIEKTGIDFETKEEDLGDYYQITIKVKK
ncbi:MAG TPA: nucleoid occlusion protein [Pseudogracilibacillus sp.]|mgnify:FL=1|nr:nucleoid occlusion protein [Pseudogracilibacillus sp.]